MQLLVILELKSVLEDILAAYKGRCKTCGEAGYKWLKNVDEYLDDVHTFATKFHEVDGFDDVVKAMKTGGNTTQDGLTHMLNYVNKLDNKGVTAFEKNIAEGLSDIDPTDIICPGCKFDVKLKIGELIGEGGNKNVYNIIGHADEVVAILRKGKPISALDNEIALLKVLSDNKLPVVEVLERGLFEGQEAIIMKKYAQGSKDIVKRSGDKIEIVGSSSLLNQKSVSDLKNIKNILVNQKIKIDDLQFLIAKDGSVVIADPLAVFVGQTPSKWNTQMIDKLIEVATKNIK